MKTFKQLSKKQQTKAVEYFTIELIKDVIERGLRFNDELNGDDLQKRIDRAIAKADKRQTPWFAHEYIMEDNVVMEAFKSMAYCSAEDALYSSDDEVVIKEPKE